MSRLLAVSAGAVAALACAATAIAHTGNPNFESRIGSVSPSLSGLRITVLSRDDRLELRNQTGREVVIVGYNREPYARLRSDGTVQVNRLSPATYINAERYGGVSTPAFTDPRAAPRWRTVSQTGRFEWHDHRIHWMSTKVPPPQVSDADARSKVFDWRVPLRVGAREGAIAGTLFWTPEDSGGPPVGAIVGLAAVVLAGAATVVVVRRRRRDGEGEEREAW